MKKEVLAFVGHEEVAARVCKVLFSPDGELVASHGLGEVIILRTGSGKTLRNLAARLLRHEMEYLPDSKFLAFPERDNGDQVGLWDVLAGQQIKTIISHRRLICLAFSPNGRYLVSGADEPEVKIWDVDKGVISVAFRVTRWGHGT